MVPTPRQLAMLKILVENDEWPRHIHEIKTMLAENTGRACSDRELGYDLRQLQKSQLVDCHDQWWFATSIGSEYLEHYPTMYLAKVDDEAYELWLQHRS